VEGTVHYSHLKVCNWQARQWSSFKCERDSLFDPLEEQIGYSCRVQGVLNDDTCAAISGRKLQNNVSKLESEGILM